MEGFNLPKNTCVPTAYKDKNSESDVSYSSFTHPSVSSRSKDHLENIFKKINSGDHVLSRIPVRLDPNIEFSDDEEEECPEPAVEKPSKEELENVNVRKENDNRKIFADSSKFVEPPRCKRPLFDNVLANRPRTISSSVLNHKENRLPPTVVSQAFPKSGNSVGNLRSAVNTYFPPIPEKHPENVNKVVIEQKTISDNPQNATPLSNDIIKVNDKIYNVLSVLGSGGSCKVYSVYDTQDKTRTAIKRVNLKDTDPLIRDGYKQEIEYLLKLKDSNRVIKMYDFEYRENELLLVLEHGDIDLSKYLSNEAKLKRLTPLKVKFYWAQMLEAVADIHKYGIVHSDLKPANFLLVAGNLKLIDFGIATSIPEDKTSTFRETQVGTLNYMSPEAITQMSADSKQPCFKVGVKSDVWSLGCILYNLVYGVTPFHHIKSLMQKIYAITNPSYEIPFKPLSDPLLLDVLKLCLKRDPKERASVEQLLKHPYLEEDKPSSNMSSMNPNPDLQHVLQQMQNLTPNRMRYVTQVVQQLSGKPNV